MICGWGVIIRAYPATPYTLREPHLRSAYDIVIYIIPNMFAVANTSMHRYIS